MIVFSSFFWRIFFFFFFLCLFFSGLLIVLIISNRMDVDALWKWFSQLRVRTSLQYTCISTRFFKRKCKQGERPRTHYQYALAVYLLKLKGVVLVIFVWISWRCLFASTGKIKCDIRHLNTNQNHTRLTLVEMCTSDIIHVYNGQNIIIHSKLLTYVVCMQIYHVYIFRCCFF